MNGADRLPMEPRRPELPPTRDKRLWIGLLAAPLAWTVLELAGVAVASRLCEDGGQRRLEGGELAILLGLSLGALALSLYGGLSAYAVFRERSASRDILTSEGHGRVEFMAFAGVLVSALLLFSILFFAIIPFLVEPCRSAL